jgi:hypothetical protein
MKVEAAINAVEAICAASIEERDRALRQAIQSCMEELNRRGVLNSSYLSEKIVNLFVEELQPRADTVRDAFNTVVKSRPKPPTDD